MKKCTSCKQIKSLEEFYNNKSRKDGKTSQCKICRSALRKANKEYNKNYMTNQRLINNDKIKKIRNKSWRGQKPEQIMFNSAFNRSKRKNIPFNLTIEDIIIPDLCPLLEIPFILGIERNYEQTFSIDRINPTKGYIKENIWVITKRANTMKSNASKHELITFAKNILKYFKDDDIVRSLGKLKEVEDKELLR